jgi:hypothetical protein
VPLPLSPFDTAATKTYPIQVFGIRIVEGSFSVTLQKSTLELFCNLTVLG